MSSAIVNKHNTAFKKRLIKEVKTALKTDKRVKKIVADFKHHFKVDKYALGYDINRDFLNPYAFNVLLEMLNYRIYYNVKIATIVFKPRSAK